MWKLVLCGKAPFQLCTSKNQCGPSQWGQRQQGGLKAPLERCKSHHHLPGPSMEQETCTKIPWGQCKSLHEVLQATLLLFPTVFEGDKRGRLLLHKVPQGPGSPHSRNLSCESSKHPGRSRNKLQPLC